MRLLWTLLLPAVALADDLRLKDGRVLSGIVVQEEDRYTVADRDRKHAFKASEVAGVDKKRCFMDEYAERFAAVSKKDAEELYAFALWLEENAWPTRAYIVYEQVVAIDPDHKGARGAMGYKLYEGEWLSPEEICRRDGLVEFEGSWYTPHELSTIKKEIESNEEAKQALVEKRAVAKKLDGIVKHFATFDKKQRAAAYDEVVRYAEELNSPLMRKFADDTRAYYDGLARALCKKMKSRSEINLTETELARPIAAIETSLGQAARLRPIPIRSLTTGFRFGLPIRFDPTSVPVTIQLPEISIYETRSTAEIPADCE
jgi:hypothetical protein